MNPNHLITAGLIFLGFAVVFGVRHYIAFRREQDRYRPDDAQVGRAPADENGEDGNGGG